MKKKIVSLLLAAAMVVSLAACGGNSSDGNDGGSDKSGASGGSGNEVTIRMFSVQTDRKNGQGMIEQMLFDQYMEENPNIRIEVEALDDEAYKTKFKAYASGSDMPDLVNVWGQPSFLSEVLDAGLLEELNQDDYADYDFVDGSLTEFTKDGKLYGLPRNTDIMGMYYNKSIFEEAGVKVPETYDELLETADTLKKAGYIPVAMDGADKWPLAIFIHDLLVKINGDSRELVAEAIEKNDFSDPSFEEAAQLLQDAYDAGLFQTGFETADYGTAMNLFQNGEAAMFYMGSWEMSMATNEDVLEEVRENIGVFMLPEVAGGAGKATDIAAWNGGGYSVSANSPVKEEALKLLNYMMKPENWSKLAWENGVCMSAQDYTPYLTGEETEPQKAFTDILIGATSISGTTINDGGTSEFKTISEDASQEVSIKSITPKEFTEKLAQ